MSANYRAPRQPTRTYRVAFANDTCFTPEQRVWIGLGVFAMGAFGIMFDWRSDPNEPGVDFTFEHWPDDVSTNPEPAKRVGGCKNAGLFVRSTDDGPDRAYLDPVGIAGEGQFIEAAAHETGHFLNLAHDIGRFPSIMSPTLAGFDKWNAVDAAEQMTSQGTLRGPTRPDFDAFDAVAKAGLLPVPRGAR